MKPTSKIEWTHCTWNPVVGCTPVSPGCLNCYAARMAMRLEAMGQEDYAPKHHEAVMGTPYDSYTPARTVHIAEITGGRPVFTGEVRTLPDRLTDPLSWKKPRLCFVNSMSDLFHKDVPDAFIDQVFAVMAITRHITYQILTKRPERMAEYLSGANLDWDHKGGLRRRICNAALSLLEKADIPESNPAAQWGGMLYDMLTEDEDGEHWPLPNVWLGTSIEGPGQWERAVHLTKCPAAVLWVSCEPLLGPLDISSYLTREEFTHSRNCRNDLCALNGDMHSCKGRVRKVRGIDWVVCGGESGPKARPMHPDWARGLRDQCAAAGVPFFFKQWGDWHTVADGLRNPKWDQKINSGVCPCGSPLDMFTAQAGTHRMRDRCGLTALSMYRVGKKAAGRLLDGVLHDAYPAGMNSNASAGEAGEEEGGSSNG